MSRFKILCAEPTKTFRQLISQVVNDLGETVVFVESVSELLNQASKVSFDLVCIANTFENDNGIKAVQAIRKIPGYLSTPVQMFVNTVSSQDRTYAFESGVNQLITRDNPEKFALTLKSLTQNKQILSGRVLIVEDSDSQAQVLQQTLLSLDLVVNRASSAEEALSLLDQHSFQLVITDLLLEGTLSGADLVRTIRERNDDAANVGVIAISTFKDTSQVTNLFNAGVDEFLAKPMVNEELVARVRSILSTYHVKAKSDELRHLNSGMVKLLDTSPDLIAKVDEQGVISYANSRFVELSKQGVLVGGHVNELPLNQESLTQLNSKLDLCRLEQNNQQFQGYGENGEFYDFLIMPEVNGAKIDFVIFSRNISNQKQLEEKLIESEQHARVANESKTRFLAAVSHELRTPLNAIYGYQQILASHFQNHIQPDDSEHTIHEHLGLIKMSAQQLKGLIDDVLEMTSIESSEVSINTEEATVASIENLIRVSNEEKFNQAGVRLNIFKTTAELSAEFAVEIDKTRLLSICNHLLSNALKFSGNSRHVDVTIEWQNGAIVINVTDFGIGISKEKLDSIFALFEQLQSGITREYGGIGIGLNLAQKQVALLNGHIHVESELGNGSSFIVSVPAPKVIKVAEAKNDLLNAAISSNDPTRKRQQPLPILIVEDSQVNQQLLQTYLTGKGLPTLAANNGAEALEEIESNRPSLIFMDVHMPVMDGIKATQAIRLMPEHGTVPIIALSADINEKAKQAALDAGMTGYITKPFDFAEIDKMINQFALTKSEPEQQVEEQEGIVVTDQLKNLINAKEGVAHAANSEDLYFMLLGTFVDEYEHVGDTLNQFVLDQNQDESVRLAHTLKGVASTLGIAALSEIGKVLQDELTQGDYESAQARMPEFAIVAAQVISEAKEMIANR